MSSKKIRNKISTIFESLRLRRFTKAVRSSKFNESLSKSLPESIEDREMVRPQLYAQLAKKTRALIHAMDDLAKYCLKHPIENNPGRARRRTLRDNHQMDFIEFWGLLEKLELRPVDAQGFEYRSWRKFIKRVRRDESILNNLQSRYSAGNSAPVNEQVFA